MSRFLTALFVTFVSARCATTAAAEFVPLGDLPGGFRISWSRAISSDGRVVVGQAWGTDGAEAFRWTRETGMVGLGSPSNAMDLSADGDVIAGSSYIDGFEYPAKWSAASGWEFLDHRIGYANGVTSDGATIVGTYFPTEQERAFRWNAQSGLDDLGELSGGADYSEAHAISGDGTTIVGWSDSTDGQRAFRWTREAGMVSLGIVKDKGESSQAMDVSLDGSVIVGFAELNGLHDGYHWTIQNGVVPFGDEGEWSEQAAGKVSLDGTLLLGGNQRLGAAVWDLKREKSYLFEELLTERFGLSAELEGWHLYTVTGVSADHRTFIGDGMNPTGGLEGWVATIPEPSAALLAAMGGVGVWVTRRRYARG